MERTITGTVEKVYDPTASNRPWNIVIDGKRCAAWAPKGSSGDRCPLAEVARSYVGSNVEAKVAESQNGEYINYKLLSIKLADFGATEHSTSTTPAPTAPAADTRQESIEKQNARTTAFTYAAHAGLDIEQAFDLANRLYYWTPSQPSERVAVAAAETDIW